MNTLSMEQKVKVISALVEGNSIRSIERMTGVHRDTIMRLMVRTGEACQELLDAKMRHLRCRLVECDEIWTFCFVKQKRLNGDHNHAEMGDQYVFVALDAETKLVPCFCVGKRNPETTWHFIQDLQTRLAPRIQLTTDGFRPYVPAVEDAFGADVDFSQLVKVYEHDESKRERFTRLTNAFSKKLANLKAALALHFAYYNFVRIHRTLRVTPAMASGISDHVWSLQELLIQGG